MISTSLTLDTCNMHLRGLIFISDVVNREKEPHIRCIHLIYSKVGNTLCSESSYFFPLTIKGVEIIRSDEDILSKKREKERERKGGREAEGEVPNMQSMRN